MKVQFLLLMIFLVCIGCESDDTSKGEDSDNTGYSLLTVPFNKVILEDQFWKPRLETQVETLVPFALEKTIPAIESLELAGNYLKGDKSALPTPHRFRTSDLYKVMEGASYLLMDNRDPALEKQMDDIIDIIADAQKEDGYLYVAHITGVSKDHDHWGGGGMGDKPYSFVLHSHEVYNMGHMYEGAIAYYQATGKDKWLKVAEKSAQHINKVFFEGDPNYNDGKPVNQAPGHQEMEIALAKLYRLTGNELYLEMAKKFLDIRGVTYTTEGEGVMSATYAQQHKPVKEQDKAVGHAVRAMYMYSGMADVGALLSSDEYSEALNKIWHNIVDTKMAITGGLGAVHGIEGFGYEYVLPNKEAYNETCAAVGNVFFNFRMFLLTQDARHMDVAEVALLNNALAGVNIEGNRFFYVNPLEADGLTQFNHGNAGRSPWFGTACCPSNIARLMPQVSGMMYSHTGDELYVTFYAGSRTSIPLESGSVNITQETTYPFGEQIKMKIDPKNSQEFSLKLRIPTWARSDRFVPGDLYQYKNNQKVDWMVKVNGDVQSVGLDKGFAVIERTWNPGDEVELVLPMKVRFSEANENIEADKNRLAVTRGPLVYCAEGVDNKEPVQRLLLKSTPASDKIHTSVVKDGLLKNVTIIEFPLKKVNLANNKSETFNASMVPYYAWNNRGNGSMIIWFPTKEDQIIYLDGDVARGGKFKTVKASYTGPRGSLTGITEPTRPESSHDRTIQPWLSHPERGKSQWVEIELANKKVNSVGVYWYDDNRQINVPESWSLEYKVNGQWKPFDLAGADSYGTEKNVYNTIHPESQLSCDALRIKMKPQEEKAMGILDVKVAY